MLRLHLNLAAGYFALIIALKLQLKLVHHLIFFHLLGLGLLFLACETFNIIITINGHEELQVAHLTWPTLPRPFCLSFHLEVRLLLLLL